MEATQYKEKAGSIFKRPVVWFYGIGSIAYGIKNNAFSYLLLIFANQVLGIPAVYASLALAIAMLWDAMSDPLIGHWSDKTNSALGRRHPFMYASLAIFPLSFFALFTPVITVSAEDALLFGMSSAWWYVLVLAILIRTATTLFEVPNSALLPELENDYDRRNSWLMLRHGFGWWGGNGYHCINFFFFLGTWGYVSHTGYSVYGTVGAIIIALVIIISATGTQKVASSFPRPRETFKFSALYTEVKQIVEAVWDRNFAAIFFYGLISAIAGGLGTALYIYLTAYFFAFSPVQVATTAIFVMLSPFFAARIIPFLAARFEKKYVCMASGLFFIVVYPMPYLMVLAGFWPELGSTTSLIIYTVFIVIEVTGLVVNGSLRDSMIADIVENREIKTNRRSEGLFFAFTGFAAKATSGGGIIAAGSIITLAGMDNVRDVAQMTMEIRTDLIALFLPIYLTLQILGLLCVMMYRITRDQHNANLSALAGRKADTLAAESSA